MDALFFRHFTNDKQQQLYVKQGGISRQFFLPHMPMKISQIVTAMVDCYRLGRQHFAPIHIRQTKS